MKKKQPKALIVTWYDNKQNYGQTLQAYALQKVLRLMKINARTLTYNKYLKNNSWKEYYQYKYQNETSSLIKQVLFTIFIWKHMRITRPCNDLSSFQNYVDKWDVDYLFCGSDQIWNPLSYTKVFVLGIKTNAKKIGYALSTTSLESYKKYDAIYQKMSPYLKEFDAISVREESAKDIFRHYTDVPIQSVLDPTMLLSREQWDHVRKKTKRKKKPYLFCYLLGEDKEYQKHIIYIMKKHHLKQVIMIDSEYLSKNNIYSYYGNIGPSKWLDLIANAGAVLTDSFHGTIFSIIYEKEFYSVERKIPASVWHPRKGTLWPYLNPNRMEDLLQTFHLSDRKILNCKEIIQCSEIDWMLVKKIWKIKRKKAIYFLKKSIK